MTATAPPTTPAEYGNLPTGAAHDVTVDLEPVRIRVLDRFGAPWANADCAVDTPLLGTRTVTTDGQGWLKIQCPKGTEHVDLKLTEATEDAERRVLLQPPADDDDKQTKRRLLNLGFDGTVDGAGGDDSSSDDGSAGDSGGSGDNAGGDSGGASNDAGAGNASVGASDAGSDPGGASGGDVGDSGSGSGGDSSGGSGGPTDPAQIAFLREHGVDPADDDFDTQLDRIESDYQTLDDPSERDLTMLDDQIADDSDSGERT